MTSPIVTQKLRSFLLLRLRRASQAAFSLIEVVVAMAIVSFSLLAIVGLLPIGLKSVRDSENDQAQGTIATQLQGQLQQISFSTNSGNINDLATSNNYYSVEGLPIVSTTPTNVTTYYRATFAISTSGVADGETAFQTNNSCNFNVTLAYPAPVYTQTNKFTIFATSQTGK